MNLSFLCPETGEVLTESSTHWSTAGGRKYPVIDGIPWLIPRPSHMVSEWQVLTQQELSSLKSSAELARAELALTNLPLTTKRLEKLATAFADQAQIVEGLTRNYSATTLGQPVAQAMQKILPSNQKLLSYTANLFRDWSWGDEENQKTLALVQKLLPKGTKGTFLHIGCGSGRLMYDVHQSYAPDFSVGVDINPLFLGVADRMYKGSEVSLYEFPPTPIASDKACVLRTLKAPKQLAGKYRLVLANLESLPFADQSMDVVFTPWLLDIVPYSTAQIIRRVHRLLKKDGIWVQLGPLGFRRRHLSENLCADELVALANGNGFQVGSCELEFLPYIQSPIDSQQRMERMTAFAAKRLEIQFPNEKMQAFPPWLENPSLPVPKLTSIEASLFVHRLYAEVLTLVDGKNSIDSIASILNTNFHLSPEDAQGVSIKFFRSAWEAELWA
jgi:ubiquinone/menaquinone biosynthesis C-methylase UbiE